MTYTIKDVLEDAKGPGGTLVRLFGTQGIPYRNAMRALCQQIAKDSIINTDEVDTLPEETVLTPAATKLLWKAQEVRRTTLERVPVRQSLES